MAINLFRLLADGVVWSSWSARDILVGEYLD